jgi:histidinol-phosphate aminotransferase
VLIVQPTFTLYKLMSGINGATVVEVLLRREDFSYDIPAICAAIETHQPGVVVICSPNNPTGSALTADDWRAVCSCAPGLVVADQAYVEFGGYCVAPLLEEFPRLVMLRTFSKAGTLAGLRVGYSAASPDITEQIAKAKLPYNLNFFSMTVAEMVVRNWARFEPVIAHIRAERDRVYAALDAMPGVRVYPSAANFLLFETERPPSEVFRGVYDKGVLIRDVSKYPLLSKALRVSIGTPDENNAFLSALRATLGV